MSNKIRYRCNAGITILACYILSLLLIWLLPFSDRLYSNTHNQVAWKILYYYIDYLPALSFIVSLWEIRQRKRLLQAWTCFLLSLGIFIFLQWGSAR